MDGTPMRSRFSSFAVSALHLFGLLLISLAVAAFHTWLVLNWLLGCCDGGICIPDWYSACKPHQQEIPLWSPFMTVSTPMPPTN
jgi:hypothetical protein